MTSAVVSLTTHGVINWIANRRILTIHTLYAIFIDNTHFVDPEQPAIEKVGNRGGAKTLSGDVA